MYGFDKKQGVLGSGGFSSVGKLIALKDRKEESSSRKSMRG